MKRKKTPGSQDVRHLVALSAAAATVWTVARTADWGAVAVAGTQLAQRAALAEKIVRQELIRPAEESAGVMLNGWEELVVAQSPVLLIQRTALQESAAEETQRTTGEENMTREVLQQAAEGTQQAFRAVQQQGEQVQKEAKGQEKAKRKRKQKKLDTSKLKVSDIELDNHTDSIRVKLMDYFSQKPKLTLKPAKAGPQILIVHTHTTESYTKGAKDTYKETDPARTTNPDYNMVRVGEEMKEVFEEMGLSVVHDTTKYDYPSYNGSYARALTGIEEMLKKYPTIQVVLDVHRDAIIDSNGVSYAKRTKLKGKSVAQVMLVVGTNDIGLEHPNWKDHLALAVQIQKNMLAIDKSFPREIDLRSPRFNEHATPGSLLVEVGTSGNTLKEALSGARCFAQAAGALYLECVEE